VPSVGDGPERSDLEQAVVARLSNIQFIGSLPKRRMPLLVNAACATFKTVYPNKVFD
jgi:hypothetical protein